MRAYQRQPSGTVSRARDLRRNATEAEKLLWRALREKLPQAKFRRQVPLGPYFADFLSFSAKLILEIDGGQHCEALEYDAARTRSMEAQGYRVLRFWNNDVLGNLDGVLIKIANSLSPREREGAAQRRKGEGDQPYPITQSPSPSQADAWAPPSPVGRGAAGA